MSNLNFYDIDPEYLDYLRAVDPSVPNHTYANHNKFFCGVVTQMNGFYYFAPVSSFNRQQATNLVIKNPQGKNIASIRFCFMVPATKSVLQYKDFSLEQDEKYVELLSTELNFCRQNQARVLKTAQRVYSYGTIPTHPQFRNCCKFLELEEAAKEYQLIAKK